MENNKLLEDFLLYLEDFKRVKIVFDTKGYKHKIEDAIYEYKDIINKFLKENG